MADDASAYVALGLEPGADAAAIEQAYKRLIKEHHPDREGGDGKRAAEITKAYRELKSRPRRDALEMHDHPAERQSSAKRWVFAAMVALVSVGTLLLAADPTRPLASTRSAIPLKVTAAKTAPTDAMDEPLTGSAIDSAVRDALRLTRNGDEMAMARSSEACHHDLRAHPSIGGLDRCVAFDDAVIVLQDRDPLHDRGPFSEPIVTGRQWAGATALSSDYLAIDGRFDRIRLRVETLLAPDMADESN